MTETTELDLPLVDRLNAASAANHHAWLGFEVTEAKPGAITAVLDVRADHLNPMGGLHGGVVSSFADSLCGYGAVVSLPEGATGFTTVNLSASYLTGASLGDRIEGRAAMSRGGRRIQHWTVTLERDGIALADVAITQLVIYPRQRSRD